MKPGRARPLALPLALAFTLALALLLPGCARSQSAGSDTTQGTIQGSTQSSGAAEEAAQAATLSADFEAIAANEALLLYSGDALAGLQYPEYILCDEGILLYEVAYSESSESVLALALMDPQTGSLVATATLACEFLTDIRQTDAGLMLCDSGLGTVTLLDADLDVSEQWSLEATYEYWYVGADDAHAYLIDDGALVSVELAANGETGASETLLESDVSLYGGAAVNGGANISYVDEQTQLACEAWLDLATGELSTPGFDEALTALTCANGTWFATVAGTDEATYILGTAEDAQVVELAEGSLAQTQGGDALLWESGDGLALALYDATGAFAASCTFDDDTLWHYGNYCTYSTVYEGFFLLVYTQDAPQLYFWDAAAGEGEGAATDAARASTGAGADLATVPLSEYEEVPAGSAVSAGLYERAAALAEASGLEILIADQCPTAYDDFDAEQELDEAVIAEALDILEEALAAYPDGFIEQLNYDQITGVRINICGTLTPTSDTWGDESYNGLTEASGNRYIMVLDANQLYADTVYHEISHIIDSKLAWDAYCREDALFSEDAWAALNPEGFEYAYVYSGFGELDFGESLWSYFIDSYSMVSPTEDRARIMEFAMAGYSWYFDEYDGLDAKLSYYSACIRDAFDTTGWPEATAWEAAQN